MEIVKNGFNERPQIERARLQFNAGFCLNVRALL